MILLVIRNVWILVKLWRFIFINLVGISSIKILEVAWQILKYCKWPKNFSKKTKKISQTFNIYINDFIHTLAHNNVFQYAEDFQILLSFDKKSSFYDIVAKINTTINIAKNGQTKIIYAWTQVLPLFNRNSVFQKMPFFTSSSLLPLSSLQSSSLLFTPSSSSSLDLSPSTTFHNFNCFHRNIKS